MRNVVVILSILFISITSCKDSNKNLDEDKREIKKPLADLEDLTSDYMKWWSYHYYEISFSSDFDALNEKSENISKDEFFKKLISENYITIELESDGDYKTYKLFELPKGAEKNISATIKGVSAQAYNLFKLEGAKFPEFDVVDLNGIQYTNESLKGKTTVIKTWFIACKPCFAEMPELNEFVRTYRDEADIQFLSLALDTKPLLENFLNNTEFVYVVIAEQEKLTLTAYPTHLVVDENGIIKKVIAKASELISYIDNDRSLKQKKASISNSVTTSTVKNLK